MRILNLEVFVCRDCPYCQYDGHYSRSRDSGYDCKHPDSDVGRIVDDQDIEDWSTKKNKKGWPPIPKECPLPIKQ